MYISVCCDSCDQSWFPVLLRYIRGIRALAQVTTFWQREQPGEAVRRTFKQLWAIQVPAHPQFGCTRQAIEQVICGAGGPCQGSQQPQTVGHSESLQVLLLRPQPWRDSSGICSEASSAHGALQLRSDTRRDALRLDCGGDQ